LLERFGAGKYNVLYLFEPDIGVKIYYSQDDYTDQIIDWCAKSNEIDELIKVAEFFNDHTNNMKLDEIEHYFDQIFLLLFASNLVGRYHGDERGVIKKIKTYRRNSDQLMSKINDLLKDSSVYKDKPVLIANGQIYTGQEIEQFLRKNDITLQEKELSSDQVVGYTASPGKVQGTVRIVNFEDDLTNMSNDNIVVTAMTIPAYIPKLKNVKGIITDEGGVLSHAAIIARELKIPTITGTKNATKVLKNDDVIILDATDERLDKPYAKVTKVINNDQSR